MSWNDPTNPDEWAKLFAQLVPKAMAQLREKFGLIQLNQGDSKAAEGALWSAQSSFYRHLMNGQLKDDGSLEGLALELVRIADNRWQRNERRPREKLQHTESAIHQPDQAPSPLTVAEETEFLEKFREVVDQIVEGLKAKDNDEEFRIVHMWVDDPTLTLNQIAQEFDVSISRVWRVRDRFRDRVLQSFQDRWQE